MSENETREAFKFEPLDINLDNTIWISGEKKYKGVFKKEIVMEIFPTGNNILIFEEIKEKESDTNRNT